jgi:ribosomal protein L28
MWLKKRRQVKMAKNVSNRSNMSAQNRPFSLKATKKTQKVNLQPTVVDGKKVRLSTKEIRAIKKNK